MAAQGYGIHGIKGTRLIPNDLVVYLSLLLMIRCVSATPTGTASDDSNISPTVIVAIVVACLAVPSAIWTVLQIWQWFSGDNSGSPSGCMGNQVLPALQSNSGTIGNIYGGNWSQNEDPSRLGNRRRGLSPSQEGSEERDALLGTRDQSPSTRSSDGEGLELHELNGRTALPYRDQQQAACASVSVTVDGTTDPNASRTRMNLPADEDEDEGLILQQGA
ncbi:Histidine kinase [Lasiodiplodia theobromae]|uniref:Histidine kinase n=1 Tax=Lasiodiplodia theobromae TaxID=45133 RepID=UPI0015C37216|nr:Histidine kinase [Lasiodiplodia theobromae]KAF4541866.1 Histidine kinase [Lasiodiplodia theobromae]